MSHNFNPQIGPDNNTTTYIHILTHIYIYIHTLACSIAAALHLDGPIRANRFTDSRESLDSARIVSGFPNWTPFLRIALRGGKSSESHVWGDSHESLARYENRSFSANRFAQIDSRESPRFVLRIAGPSRLPLQFLLDDRQITHLICVCLRHMPYDFFRGCFGPFV